MHPTLRLLSILFLAFLISSCGKQEQKVLLFGQVTESNRETIENTKAELEKLGTTQHFSTRFTDDATLFTEDSLKQYAALIFLYTSGEVLNDVQRADVERFAQAGGGVLGLDAQPEVSQAWPWYQEHISQESAQISLSSEQLGDQIKSAISSTALDYQLARTQRVPEETRFVKEVLDFNLNEPMELDELPGRGLLFVERRGALKLYDFQTATTKKITQLPLFYGNEDGLLGVAVDPKL